MAYANIKALFVAICDAIRVKDGTSGAINHQDIPARIKAISAGGSLQSKSVVPSEAEQLIEYDEGYYGLSSVSVRAISKDYIGSSIIKKAAQTYIPGTSDQTIASGQYLNGIQTISGDENLKEENIRENVTIFGKTGTYAGNSSAGSDNNCEAYIVDATNPNVIFKNKTGTIKAWGYGVGTTSGWTQPKYAFQGDNYLTISSYGSGSTTAMTLGVDASGNITGLPTLNSGTLLITREI